MKPLHGIIPALVVPLTDQLAINEPLFRKHLDFILRSRVHGLYIGGSTGEGPILQPEVREHAVDIALDHVRSRETAVIVHVGAVDSKTTIRLAKHAERAGADAISAVPPFYYSVDSQSLYNYYKTVAEAVHIPLIIYNIPELTGVVVRAKDAEKLSAIDNIIGIKFSSSDLSEMRKMKEINHGDFKVFFGVDQILLTGLVMGAGGGIGGTYNYMPEKYVEVYEHVQNNDWMKAAKVQYEIARYYDIVKQYGNAISCIKTVVSIIHQESMGPVTPPLRDLTVEEKRNLLTELRQQKFFDYIGLSTDRFNAIPQVILRSPVMIDIN
jgi:N-acetylneuraminate lyase